MDDRLREFFAVTLTSVYRVSDRRDADGIPLVEKIAQRGSSAVAVGGRLKSGSLIGVTKRGIYLYDDDLPYPGRPGGRPARPEEVDVLFWADHTSPVVGLFLNEADARGCLDWGHGREHDPVWWSHTMAVIKAIGDDHPTFILSRDPRFAFVFGQRR